MSAIKANQVLNLDGDRIGSVVVDSIANMKNLNPEIEANATVELLGYYSKGDGGGGTFYWDSSIGIVLLLKMIMAVLLLKLLV